MNIKSETMLRRTLRIALSLTVICICVALAVSVSYTLTRDKIEEKRIATERAAISAVFEADGIEYRSLDGAPDTVSAVFEVCLLYTSPSPRD